MTLADFLILTTEGLGKKHVTELIGVKYLIFELAPCTPLVPHMPAAEQLHGNGLLSPAVRS